MLIFIGSSTEERDRRAQRVAKALRSDGHAVLCWWDHEAFRSGDYTLDRLIELTDECDAAVFVFGKDDQLWLAGRVSKAVPPRRRVSAPRDNVVLEYGMFVSKHGRKRVAIVTDPKVKLPSDLLGVVYTDKDYLTKVCNQFRRLPHDLVTPAGGLRIFVTEYNQAAAPVTGARPEWSSRSLYMGARGARCWRDVEMDPKYRGQRGHEKVGHLISAMVSRYAKARNVNTVVSFGPGVGTLDMKVLSQLPSKGLKRYIPVDMNMYLMVLAAQNVDGADSNTSVPYGICGDFDYGMSQITDVLQRYVSGNRLFLMLGGTFGNIESNEAVFLNGLRGAMRDADLFVLDTFIKDKSYTVNADGFRHLSKQSNTVRTFLDNGLFETERRSGTSAIVVKTSVNSDIPDTEGLTLSTREGRALLNVRRYEMGALTRFLEQHSFFQVLNKQQIPTDNPAVKRAIFLMTPKP